MNKLSLVSILKRNFWSSHKLALKDSSFKTNFDIASLFEKSSDKISTNQTSEPASSKVEDNNYARAVDIEKVELRKFADFIDTIDSFICVGARHASALEWDNFRSQCLTVYPEKSCSIDGIIMSRCHKDKNHLLAKSFLEYVQQTQGKPNLAVLAYYVSLCGLCIDEVGENEILKGYDELASRFQFFDGKTLDLIVPALCKTHRWQESLSVMDTVMFMSDFSGKVYSHVAAAAFRNGDVECGWSVMEKSVKAGKILLGDVFNVWVDLCTKTRYKYCTTNFLICACNCCVNITVIREMYVLAVW